MFKKYIFGLVVLMSLITSSSGYSDDILGDVFVFTSPIGLSSGHFNLGVGGQIANHIYLGFKGTGMVSAYESQPALMEGEAGTEDRARGFEFGPQIYYELPPIEAVRLAHYIRASVFWVNERHTSSSSIPYNTGPNDSLNGAAEEVMYFVTHEIGYGFRAEVGQGLIKYPQYESSQLNVEINIVYRIGGGTK